MQPINHTPFVMDGAVFLDKNGAEHFLIALKMTYRIALDGTLSIAEEQAPLRAADIMAHPEVPELSSIRHEAEMEPPKPATDCFLQGCACAPHAGATAVEVRFACGPVEKRAAVFGDRVWLRQMNIAVASAPRPFEKIPLTYENTFGGLDLTPAEERHRGGELRNPAGRGYRAKESRQVVDHQPLPNIEEIGRPMTYPDQRLNPVGFGPIGRHWQPRVGYAGTYDQQWLEDRLPLLPLDFDPRFHHAAPPDLVYPGFVRGDEPVVVQGCTHGPPVGFRLPNVRPLARVRLCNGDVHPEMTCQTVCVDMERLELRLLWKGWINVHRKLLRLREFECRLDGDAPGEERG